MLLNFKEFFFVIIIEVFMFFLFILSLIHIISFIY